MNSNQESLKSKIFSGVLWRFGERITAQLVSFSVSLVLARLLTPTDFGTVSAIMVFIEIANVFVVNGFGMALVQKKDADSADFSTVFYFSILFSFLVYGILWFGATLIANFYHNPNLVTMIRILSIKIPLSAVNSVQQAVVQRQMLFRKFFFATIIGTGLSAVVGIAAAFAGAGPWALIIQYLVNSTTDTIVLWIALDWRPTWEFSFDKLRDLFRFGWKILVSALLHTGYVNLRSLVIGRKYSSADLAFYNQGEKIPQLMGNNINTAITTVLFPAMASVQDDISSLKQIVRNSIKTASFFICPACIGILAVSKQMITVLYTEKWLACVPFACITAIEYLFEPIHMTNLQAIKAMGRSDVVLKMEIIKKVYGVLSILLSMKYGVMAIALAGLSQSAVALAVNTFPNRKLLNYSYREQVSDFIPAITISVIMGVIVYSIGIIFKNIPIGFLLFIQIIMGMSCYVGLLFTFYKSEFSSILEMIQGLVKRHE